MEYGVGSGTVSNQGFKCVQITSNSPSTPHPRFEGVAIPFFPSWTLQTLRIVIIVLCAGQSRLTLSRSIIISTATLVPAPNSSAVIVIIATRDCGLNWRDFDTV